MRSVKVMDLRSWGNSAGSDASAGSLAVWAPLLAGEALSAVPTFVDGVFAHGTTGVG